MVGAKDVMTSGHFSSSHLSQTKSKSNHAVFSRQALVVSLSVKGFICFAAPSPPSLHGQGLDGESMRGQRVALLSRQEERRTGCCCRPFCHLCLQIFLPCIFYYQCLTNINSLMIGACLLVNWKPSTIHSYRLLSLTSSKASYSLVRI